MTKTILIISANPLDTDRLSTNTEVRNIKACITGGKERDQFKVEFEPAVRYEDIRKALLTHKPQIVHFSGHGEKNGLIVESDMKIGEPVPYDVLAELFGLFADYVECVILNACQSSEQVDLLNKHIDYVIGMRGEILDTAAIKFSKGFYDALGDGETIPMAFALGKNAFRRIVPNAPEHLLPVLIEKESPDTLPAKPTEQETAETLQKGLESLHQQDYPAAAALFQLARTTAPDNEKARFYDCLASLAGKNLETIPQVQMDHIDHTLNALLKARDQETVRWTLLLLAITRYDYYKQKGLQAPGANSEDILNKMKTYRPGEAEKKLVTHIAMSEIARVFFKIY